ncbi:hypothetical protein NW754_002098 [Fusarium falciforme]|nr:hypothetical protein NW754_002098 [Fusarium falciforme]
MGVAPLQNHDYQGVTKGRQRADSPAGISSGAQTASHHNGQTGVVRNQDKKGPSEQQQCGLLLCHSAAPGHGHIHNHNHKGQPVFGIANAVMWNDEGKETTLTLTANQVIGNGGRRARVTVATGSLEEKLVNCT